MFKQINQLKEKKKSFELLIKRCSDYLESGIYHVTLFHGKLSIKNGKLNKKKLKNFYFKLVCGTFRVKNKKAIANCNIALDSPFHNYKLFDEANKITYTLFSPKYWKNANCFIDTMAPYLSTLIISKDTDQFVIVERIANTKKILDSEKAFRKFWDEYKLYLKESKVLKYVTLLQIKEELSNIIIGSETRECILNLENMLSKNIDSFPFIVCHNDVHLENMLTEDNESFYLIDFELCSENAYFFDVLGFIFNSSIFKKDYSLFEKYMSGALDDILLELFSMFNQKYEKSNRKEYITLFLYLKIAMVLRENGLLPQNYIAKINNFFKYLSENY